MEALSSQKSSSTSLNGIHPAILSAVDNATPLHEGIDMNQTQLGPQHLAADDAKDLSNENLNQSGEKNGAEEIVPVTVIVQSDDHGNEVEANHSIKEKAKEGHEEKTDLSPTSTNLPEGTNIHNYINNVLSGREGANNLIALTQSLSEPKSTDKQVVPQSSDGSKFVDITEYLNLPQTEAAKKLSIPTSTLSKRWKEAVVNRKWPYRAVSKIDKEIMTLLHNIPQGPDAPPLPPEIEANLGKLLKKRQEELRSVLIRL